MSNLYRRFVELLLGPVCRAATIAPDDEGMFVVARRDFHARENR